MIRTLITFALLVAWQTATRDQPRDIAGVAYSIRGVVVDAQTSAPIRRARVEATRADGERSTSVSDAQGRFAVSELRPGTYTLSVNKEGYLTGGYGQVKAGGSGLPIEIPGDLADFANGDARITIFRGGVIAGRVVDERGDAVPLAQVRALQYQYESGGPRLSWAAAHGSQPLTDDLGAFRVYGLRPGRYAVGATAGVSSLVAGPPAADARLPLSTYFPNATDAANARMVLVAAGKETTPVTITLATGRPVRVRGRVVTATGEPFEGGVSAAPHDGRQVVLTSRSSVRPDGSFELRTILPGTYLLTARDPMSNELKDQQLGHAVVTVGTEDLDDVVIVTGTPGIARGRVVTDDGSPLARAVAQIKVSTVSAAGPDRPWRSNGAAAVKDDGAFEIGGLFGVHAFQVDAANQLPWSLASVWHADRDVTDAGVAFGPDDIVDDITVVVTRVRNELTGTVVDADGRPAAGAGVIIFPADPSLWKWTRWARATTADRGGRFRLVALPPYDRYLAVAAPNDILDDAEWRNTENLNELRAHALAFPLGAGEKKSINLPLVTK